MFCYPEHIDAQVRQLFVWLTGHKQLRGLSSDAFAEHGAHVLAELNAIHPFRDGNGRSQMAFFAMLADHAGHPLDFDRLEPEDFLAAMVRSFSGDTTALAAQIRGMI